MGNLTNTSPAEMLHDYVIAYLAAQSQSALLTGWVWVIGKMPDDPDQVICFIDQSGPASYPNLLVDFMGLQVLIRGSRSGDSYKSSYLLARTIRDCIVGMPNHPTQFPELDGVTERGNIAPLGYDDRDRHMWSANYSLIVEPGANAITHRFSL